MTTLSEPLRGGDILLHVESLEYCCVSSKITNPAGAGTTANLEPIGQPLKLISSVWNFVLAADIANATAIVVSGPKMVATVAASGVTLDAYLILKQPPAIIDQDLLPANDSRGAAITAANFKSALSALKFELRSQSTNKTTQTE